VNGAAAAVLVRMVRTSGNTGEALMKKHSSADIIEKLGHG